MNTKTATIIDIKATDRTKYAQATRISWSHIAFVDNTRFLVTTDSHNEFESNHKLCFVSRPISSEQKGLNNIFHNELAGEEYYKNVLADVMARVQDDYIVCFDAKQTIQILKHAGVPTDAFNFICMSTVIKKLHPGLGSYTIATLIYEFYQNAAIAYMPHNWQRRYDATFMRYIFKQVSILNNLQSMQDWYELSTNKELAHG